MKVSIIIPAHNEEDSLAETLRHVLALDHSDFEVIVVDNASSDRTSEIARRFPILLVHEKIKGLLHARECGRRHAKGEIIANIDADCLPDPDWLSKGLPHFNDPQVVSVSGPYDYYDSKPWFRTLSSLVQTHGFSALSRFLVRIGKQGVMIGGNNLIRGRVLELIGGYNTEILFYGEDTDTAKRVSKQGKIVYNRQFVMKSSGRRFKRHGTLIIFLLYIYHFLKVSFFSRTKI
jgi:glycosyltransferase involved in cell wall biosynthesis